ncbi:MAG: flagellar biosynthesis protein FlhF [Deltaproteobacteria bacterium]|nr:flagellar biosynthesis protein FlhF [Deltaproteobacteria bacterium]MBW2140052.1 flagellar biosynthesis protein FlhF [Deltaproteobacteria bacterium]MBW2322082.1 flagellar biosynthesis protein FlhF [Deltaproteobacteria bacterium]
MMQVKRFEALDMKTALAKVKEELGPGAVILSTKEEKNEGGLPPSVEITAVADYSSTILKNSAFSEKGSSGPQKYTQGSHMNQPSLDMGLEGEISQIKELLLDLTYRSKLSERLRNRKDLVRLYRDLIDSELDPSLARGLVEQVAAMGNGTGPDPKTILMKKLSSLLRANNPVKFSNKTGFPAVLVLIGPSGVGKTTTLAKIAAVMSLQKKKKVALISLDSYRLGAVDQLLTYSRIMGLPFKAAQDKEEFEQWVDLFEDMDFILVDTPGRTLSDPDRLDELAEVINGCENASTLLVLSATTKDRNLAATIERVRNLPVKGLIISMIDETDRYGNVINNLIKFKAPVSYLTNGQKVPDDLIPATPSRLAALIDPERTNT